MRGGRRKTRWGSCVPPLGIVGKLGTGAASLLDSQTRDLPFKITLGLRLTLGHIELETENQFLAYRCLPLPPHPVIFPCRLQIPPTPFRSSKQNKWEERRQILLNS